MWICLNLTDEKIGDTIPCQQFGAKSDHGLSRLYYGLPRCSPGVAPEALRCVPIRHGSAPGIDDRAPVSLRGVTEVGWQSPGVTR